MRRSVTLFLTGLMIAMAACSYRNQRLSGGTVESPSQPITMASSNGNSEARQSARQSQTIAKSVPNSGEIREPEQQPALDSAGAVQAVNRKVIQNADMTIETDAPTEGQRKITAIASKNGGFVVISESKQNEAASQAVASTVVNVVVRVPAQNFEPTIAEIRSVGGRILHEKSSGQDVTEEYIDLEARIRTKRALEAQFLEIMKQARKISDAMEVQTQLADVRTEIERLEGRRRFLENQSALSTINITLHTPTPVVAAATRGFIYDLKAAFGDGLEIGTDIFLSLIRFIIVMIPITTFILLPLWLVFKWLRRRIQWPFKVTPLNVTSPNE
jgi:Domain of unknown function (DUF4349)